MWNKFLRWLGIMPYDEYQEIIDIQVAEYLELQKKYWELTKKIDKSKKQKETV